MCVSEALLQHHSAALAPHLTPLGLHTHSHSLAGHFGHPLGLPNPSPLGQSTPGPLKQETKQDSARVKEEKNGDRTDMNSSSSSISSAKSSSRSESDNSSVKTPVSGREDTNECRDLGNKDLTVGGLGLSSNNTGLGLSSSNTGSTQRDTHDEIQEIVRPAAPPPPLPASPLPPLPRVLCTQHSVDAILQVRTTVANVVKDELISPSSSKSDKDKEEEDDDEDSSGSSGTSDSDNSDSDEKSEKQVKDTDSEILTVDNDSQSSEQTAKVDTETITSSCTQSDSNTDSSSSSSHMEYAPIKVEPVENSHIERPERNPKERRTSTTDTSSLVDIRSQDTRTPNESPVSQDKTITQIKKEQISPKSTGSDLNRKSPNHSRSPNPNRSSPGESEPNLKVEQFSPGSRPVSRNFSLPSFQYSISPPATAIGPGRKVHATTYMPQVGTLPSPTATTATLKDSGCHSDDQAGPNMHRIKTETNGHQATNGKLEGTKLGSCSSEETIRAANEKSKAKGKKGSPPTPRRANQPKKDTKVTGRGLVGKGGGSKNGIECGNGEVMRSMNSKTGSTSSMPTTTNPSITSPLLLSTLSNISVSESNERKTPSSLSSSLLSLPSSTSAYMMHYAALYPEEERQRLSESGWIPPSPYYYFNPDLSPRSRPSAPASSVTSTSMLSSPVMTPHSVSKSDNSSASISSSIERPSNANSHQEVYTISAGLNFTTGGQMIRTRSPPPPLLPPNSAGNGGLRTTTDKNTKPVVLPPVALTSETLTLNGEKTGSNRKDTPNGKCEESSTSTGKDLSYFKYLCNSLTSKCIKY